MPYAQHTWESQTGGNGDGWKYQWARDSIRGFQQAHQCSSWTHDYNVFSLMAVVGALKVDQFGRAARFSHANETGCPHYYSVRFGNDMRTEMSPSDRGVYMRFSFPRSGDAWVVFNGYTRWSSVQIDSTTRRITGYVTNGSGLPEEFKNYFIIKFDQPFVSYGTWTDGSACIEAGSATYGVAESGGAGAYVQFRRGARVQARMASSYIGPEQAEITWKRESSAHKTLEQTRAAAHDVWGEQLNLIKA